MPNIHWPPLRLLRLSGAGVREAARPPQRPLHIAEEGHGQVAGVCVPWAFSEVLLHRGSLPVQLASEAQPRVPGTAMAVERKAPYCAGDDKSADSPGGGRGHEFRAAREFHGMGHLAGRV